MNFGPTARCVAARPGVFATAGLRAIGRLGFIALACFHIWLLGRHLLDGSAFEPATAVRWALAVVALAGFRALSRRGFPLFVGRRAVGLWLLVVIIHCSAASEGGAAAALDSAIPESTTVLAHLSVATLVFGAALAAAFAAAPNAWTGGRPARSLPVLIAGLPTSGFVFRFSPRPPPLA